MICYEYPPLGGGGGHVVKGLIGQLLELGHEVDLITMGFKNIPPYEQFNNFSIFRINCIRRSMVVCHSYEMMSYLLMALPKAVRLTSKKNYDIIHAHFVFPDGILAYLLSQQTGIPYIITTHGSDVPGFNPDRFVLMHKLLRPLWVKILQSCSQVICMSQFLETLLKNAMPEADTVIIPNGFPVGRFNRQVRKADRILIVTRMFKRKGVQYFLKAVDKLKLGYEIHIMGDGPYLHELRQQAISIDSQVEFHGFVENHSKKFTKLMEASKIFVFPSESDNFPIVLLEAMDAGLAIITTKNTGCEEVVGNTALLVNPGNVDELRKAILELVSSPIKCSAYGKMAQKRIDHKFSWHAVARKYVQIYDQVINFPE